MYDFDPDPDYDAGKAPIAPNSEPFASLWVAALRLYFDDCTRYARGAKSHVAEGLAAHRDLFGSQDMLRRLCRPIDANPETIARAMMQQVEAQAVRPKAKPKPKPAKRRKAA